MTAEAEAPDVSGDAAVSSELDTGWVKREYWPERDEDGMMYLLGVGYTRSRAGWRAGAQRAGGSRTLEQRMRGATPGREEVDAQLAFLAAHRPMWSWLLANAEVTLAVDAQAPQIIWGWCVTSGPDVVHAVGCKRSLVDIGVGLEVVRDLLGDRWDRHQVCTLELPQLRTRGDSSVLGVDRPRGWSLDPTWLLTRMGAGAGRAA